MSNYEHYDKRVLDLYISQLPIRTKIVLRACVFGEVPQAYYARKWGISRTRVHQLIHEGFALIEKMAKDGSIHRILTDESKVLQYLNDDIPSIQPKN